MLFNTVSSLHSSQISPLNLLSDNNCLTNKMTSSSNLRALVFGASGITGWAIAKEALQYPTPSTFDQIIALTNRPLSKAEALFPDDDRLQLYSGINLSAGVDEVEAGLKKIPGIEGVTHVYFSGRKAQRNQFNVMKMLTGLEL